MLLYAGADINAPDLHSSGGRTPYDLAIARNRQLIAGLLGKQPYDTETVYKNMHAYVLCSMHQSFCKGVFRVAVRIPPAIWLQNGDRQLIASLLGKQ